GCLRFLRHDRRPVRRDGGAERAPPAGDERLGAYLRLRSAVPAQAPTRGAHALPAPRQGGARMVDAPARRGRVLLQAGARPHSLSVSRSTAISFSIETSLRNPRPALRYQ